MLPDYALFKVNLREGWQILSDIGHIHDVTWEGQNKLYSASHALTRRFCSSEQSFKEFVDQYEWNLEEYYTRRQERTVYHEKFDGFWNAEAYWTIQAKFPKNKYESTRRYLLEYKTKHLTEEEIERLKNQ